MSAEQLTQLVGEIQALAKAEGVSAHQISRTKFREAHGSTKRERNYWGEARRIAAGKAQKQAQSPPVLPVPMGHRVKGVSTYVNADGKVVGQWIKSAWEGLDPEELIKRLGERIKDEITVRTSTITEPKLGRGATLLAVYPQGDPHIGMRAPGYGLKEALTRHKTAIDALVSMGPDAYSALLLDLGDSMHVDLGKKTTTKGTEQDVDGLWHEIVLESMDLKIYQIDRLLERHNSVEVWNVAGNHDKVGAFAIALALHHHYRNEPRVKIPINPTAVWYMRHGQCMIASSHGDTIKNTKDMALAAAHDRAAMWGLTKHRYWYGGHLHHRKVKEEAGMIIEIFRTLAPQDSFHQDHGYRAGQEANKIWLDSKHGEVARSTINGLAL